MCILFIFTDPNPTHDGYRLILASNRDEYYARPAMKAFKCEKTQVIAGRDMEPGREYGSWLGVSWQQMDCIKYRIGSLLNVTGETKPSAKGRGFIVIDYLEQRKAIKDYQREIHANDGLYSSYNFVTVDLGRSQINISHTTNVPNEMDTTYEGKQILAFGNSTVRSPLRKVTEGRCLFEDVISKFNRKSLQSKLEAQLMQLLKSRQRYLPDAELKCRASNFCEDLSSIFVQFRVGNYGTRTHTIVLVDYDWQLHFKEVTMDEHISKDSPTWSEANFTINQ